MLADPQEMMAESLRLALDGAPDLSVSAIATSLEELEALAITRSVDVLLLDQRLCESGVAASVRRVRTVSPTSVLLMMTAGPNEAAAVDAFDAGCAGVIPKTLSLDALVAAIRGAAAGELRL